MITWEKKVARKLKLAVVGDTGEQFAIFPAYRDAEDDDLVDAVNDMETGRAEALLRNTNVWAKEEQRLRDLIAMAVQRVDELEAKD